MRQRRLCDVNLLGSAREIEVFRQCGKIAKVPKLQMATILRWAGIGCRRIILIRTRLFRQSEYVGPSLTSRGKSGIYDMAWRNATNPSKYGLFARISALLISGRAIFILKTSGLN